MTNVEWDTVLAFSFLKWFKIQCLRVCSFVCWGDLSKALMRSGCLTRQIFHKMTAVLNTF